jgi:uncharacterized protein YkwD
MNLRVLQVSALACALSTSQGFLSDTSSYLGGLSSKASSGGACVASPLSSSLSGARRSRCGGGNGRGGGGGGGGGSTALSMYVEGPMDVSLPKFEDLYNQRRRPRPVAVRSAPGRPLRDPRVPMDGSGDDEEQRQHHRAQERRRGRFSRFAARDRDERRRSSRRRGPSRNPFARFQARFLDNDTQNDDDDDDYEMEEGQFEFASAARRSRRDHRDPMVDLLDRNDQPQVKLRNANGTSKSRRRQDSPFSSSTAAKTSTTMGDDDDDANGNGDSSPTSAQTTATRKSNQRKRPLIYDRDLNHLADAFADRMLHHGQNFDEDGVQDILRASGIDAVTVGSAWGYTNLHDGDALEAYVAKKHPEISEDDTFTHYALGFSKAINDDDEGAISSDVDDNDGADDEGRNMYMFLAVSYEERHLAHHSTAVPPAFEVHSPEEHNDVAFAVLGMVNQMRMSAGLSPLSLDNKALQRAAQWYSNDMLIHGYPTQREGGVPHIGTDGSTAEDRAEREGYKPLAVRENILSRFDMSAQGAFEQWWDSPGHRSNMMADDVTHMSLAVTCDVETGQYYYTQLFGRPFVWVQPDDLVGPLLNKLQHQCMEMNRLPFRPNEVLMDYAAILAPYVSQHGELPSNTWDNIESRYAYDEITAVVAWTPYDDPDETTRYLAKTYEEQLNNHVYTEVGVGVHCDKVSS